MIWVIFALLTGAAVFAVLWPLSRVPAGTDARELDVAFYRAQTEEIDRDAARGVIAPAEAEAARVEAARRLMAASERDPGDPADPAARRSPWLPRFVALGTLVLVPVLALSLYMDVGAPNLPDQPLEARLKADPSKMDMPTIVAKIEHGVAENPNDGRGWALLARIYAQLGRPDDAVNAYRNEIRVLGADEQRLSGLGEVETMAAGGKVTAEAARDFTKAVALDPKSPRPQFYLGLAAEQAGDKTKAVALWTKLVHESPPDAPWLPAVQARLTAASGQPAKPAETVAAADGGQAKMAAAVAAMPADQQRAMIHRMVDGLAARLKGNGGDIDGWLRLVRAYRVLDEQDKAKVALADARRNFAADPTATKRLDDLAQELGLKG